jgi:hypothetical protein
MLKSALIVALALGTATAVFAQDAPKGGGSEVYQKQQVVDFADDTIEGDLTRPDGDMFDSRKRAAHKKLIRYREHFRSEVLQSIRAL